MSEGKWSDSKKWWMDLAKSSIAFVIAALLALTVVAHFEDKRERARAKESALNTLRQTTMPDFVSAAVYYETAAYSAYIDLYQWNDKTLTPAMADYEREYFPRLLSGKEMIAAAFPNDAELGKALEDYMKAINQTFDVYDSVRDVRLDGESSTQINPSESREEFDAAREKTEESRKALIPMLYKRIYRNEDG